MEYNLQSATKLNGAKNGIMQVAYFLNVPMFKLLFCCHITLHREKWPFIEKFNLKSIFYGKFQRFNATDRSIKKMAKFPKILTKMKSCKIFYEAQKGNHSASPNQIKSYYVSGTNIFLRRYREIYRHLASKCFNNAVLLRQEMMQCKCFFWHQPEKCWLQNL